MQPEPALMKVAEEYALLDCITDGRLIAGFPVGLSYDANQNGAIPAIETRERYNEHRELILKAWAEPEPFAWSGRFEKYGQVNLWARPIQQPHPPIWIPGSGSPGTMVDVLRRNYAFVHLSWSGPKVVGHHIFDRYWELADVAGTLPAEGPGCVFDCAGTPASAQLALQTLRPLGRLLLVGLSLTPLDLAAPAIVIKELEIRGVLAYRRGQFQAAIDMLSAGAIPVAELITEIVPLVEAEAAFQALTARGSEKLKILLAP